MPVRHRVDHRLIVRVGGALLILTAVVAALLSTPEARIAAFGEWGYRHLVSDDQKVEMINRKLANPDFPLIMLPGSAWSAGVKYAEELLLCKSVSPPDFVLTGPGDKREYEVPVTWAGPDSFYYDVKGYPIKINVRILEVTLAEARILIKAEKIIPGKPTALNLEMAPNEDVCVVQRTTTVYLPSPKREGYIFTSEAYMPYDVLIAASDKQDPATGVVFRVTFTPDGSQVQEQRFPGKGPIVFESITDDNTVVTFRWGNNGRGRYELKDGTASFEK